MMINFERASVLLSVLTTLEFVVEATDTIVFKTSTAINELEEDLRVFNFRYKSKSISASTATTVCHQKIKDVPVTSATSDLLAGIIYKDMREWCIAVTNRSNVQRKAMLKPLLTIIIPGLYSFRYEGSLKESKIEHVLSEVIRMYGDKIEEIERAKECDNWIPADRIDVTSVAGSEFEQPNSHNEEKFGMNVESAWSSGYSGNGINVAVTDVGINNNIIDLKHSLNMALAFNFIRNTNDTTPEFFENYRADAMRFVDHGNRCASVIAAEKGNKLCSAGIAYKAKVIPLKVFSVQHEYHVFSLSMSTDIIAAALAYSLQQIHIFSNSWGPTKSFEPLDLSTREVIQYGATIGRNKLGVIYVVPDGSDGVSGSGYANSIYTIAVNNVGLNGTLPMRSQVSACVLTSGLGDGSTLNTRKMHTSSYNNTCINSFRGVSAAVAQVSAIIALVLESRPDLTMRDVQYLLVHSSGRENLEAFHMFKRNDGGRYYHPFFGFGLLNSEKIVRLSETWQNVGKIYNKSMRHSDILPEQKLHDHAFPHIYKRMRVLKFHFKEECGPQLNTIEHVVLQLSYNIINQNDVRIEIVSPRHTASILVDTSQAADRSDDKKTTRNLTSVHFWDESPFGHWKVKIQHKHDIDHENLESTSLTIYGTFNITRMKLLGLPWSCVVVNQTNITHEPKYAVIQTTDITTSADAKARGEQHNAVARISPLFYSVMLLATFWAVTCFFELCGAFGLLVTS